MFAMFSSLFDSGFATASAELVKQVFRGSPDVLRAGEANAVLGPVVETALCSCSTAPSTCASAS